MEIKLKSGHYMKSVEMVEEGKRLFFKFSFDKVLMAEIKAMEGAKWHRYDPKPRKQWSVTNSPRNRFQLEYLQHPSPKDPRNPYYFYEQPLVEHKTNRPCYDHQVDLIRHGLTRKQCLFAAEMGTGKTLAAIEIIEASGFLDWYWVGPKSALYSVQREFKKWKATITPKFLTYEGLKKLLETWPEGKDPPRGLICDESSRCKNLAAQRTQAVLHLANNMRDTYGRDCFVILMSGSPAPKSPMDWFAQCIASDSVVLTSEGPKTIAELQWKSSKVYVDGRLHKASPSWKTGRKQTWKITTKEGYEICATSDHRFLTDELGLNLWQQVSNLKPGQKIVLNDHEGVSWEGQGTFEEGYIIGHFYGDGSVSNNVPTWALWEKDHELIPYLKSLMPDMTYGSDGPGGKITIHSKYGTSVVREFGQDFTLDRSSEFLEGFIAGLFDTDVTAEKGRARVSIAQSDYNLLVQVQKALLFLGMRSAIHEHKEDTSEIQGRKIKSEKRWHMTISGEYAHRFSRRIGFRLSYKRMPDVINYGKLHNYATIKSIEPYKLEDVYDISVPTVQAFSANGFMAHNCEIACPGFIREGTVNKFKERLAITEARESLAGGKYLQLKAWRDDPSKCNVCGEKKDHADHKMADCESPWLHPFIPSKNEVLNLYARMMGLVIVKFKKDCLNLPDKVYRVIKCKPSRSMLNAAETIANTASSAIKALTLLRELSDGFQYIESTGDLATCKVCQGKKTVSEVYDKKDPDNIPTGEEIHKGYRLTEDPITFEWVQGEELDLANREIDCRNCDGTGQAHVVLRTAQQIPTPKESALIDILDEYSEVGRLVIYAGFTGSVDRVAEICKSQQWKVIRVDGRGWQSDIPGSPEDLIGAFQDKKDEYENVAFVAQPGAAGMGLTLTASRAIVYYSNDFNGESRIQSEDRIHRPGMDINAGATIIDILNLPADELVLNNLQKKRKLQSISLGEFRATLVALGENENGSDDGRPAD